jgi:uncharacterized protein involved in type VI secretion and phage assembly
MGENGSTNGIVIGLVDDLSDPDKLGRIRVTFPHLADKPSDWARLVAPGAGPDRGMRFVPQPGDEVLVAFEHGDPRRPYVLGALWSTTDKPPADDGNTAKNNWRFIRSRSGHVFKLDDTDGAERIEIEDKDKQRRIVIDCSGSTIQIVCDSGDVEVSAPSGKVKVDASQVEISSSGNIDVKASGTLTLQGATVNIN